MKELWFRVMLMNNNVQRYLNSDNVIDNWTHRARDIVLPHPDRRIG